MDPNFLGHPGPGPLCSIPLKYLRGTEYSSIQHVRALLMKKLDVEDAEMV